MLFKTHSSLLTILSVISPESAFKSTHSPFCNSSPPPPVSGTGQALTPPTRGGEYSLSLSFLPLSPSLRGRKGEGWRFRWECAVTPVSKGGFMEVKMELSPGNLLPELLYSINFSCTHFFMFS